jgi:NADPH-dependent 2,4-dienoyl-CoA reductase/sulfur reductase-like enzyme
MTSYDYLIVGGGMTADAAAHGIREIDQSGTIGIIAAESHAPYNRPPLSKGLWKEDGEDGLWRGTQSTNATVHLGRSAATLDAASKTVTDDAGEEYRYGKLLLASGGTPRRLDGAPDGVIYFRTLDDYRTTRRLAEEEKRFIVIGGGFIGSEVAAAVRMQGCAVTMVVPEAGIGARVFPADLARFVARYYREKGVIVHLNDSVTRIATGERGGYAVGVKTAGPLTADAVIAGLGIVPNVALAEQAGLTVDNGIVVDEHLCAGPATIFAAGDVARFHNPALGRRMRVEHEDNANTMGKAAGRNMAGAGERYDHLPFFYSDLFELGYEAVGDVDARHETVADWKDPFREGVVYYLDGGRVRGVLLWNTWGQVDAARALIAQPGPFTAADLKGLLPE